MNFKLIVAICKNGGIGIDGKLPWHLKDDLKRFSKLTRGNGKNAIIMGRNTWLSIPNKPLKHRDNLILSNSFSLTSKEHNILTQTFTNIETLEKHCKDNNYEDIWIIGGQKVYEQFIKLNKVDEIHVTFIDKLVECDTFFPSLPNNYILTKHENYPVKVDLGPISYLTYKKISSGMKLMHKNEPVTVVESHEENSSNLFYTVKREDGTEVQTVRQYLS